MINNYIFFIFIITISLLIMYFIQFNLFMNKHEDWEEYNKIVENIYSNNNNDVLEKHYKFICEVLELFWHKIEKNYTNTVNYIILLFNKFINNFYSMSGYIINKNKKEGFCFSGDNLIKLSDGKIKKMSEISLGETLEGGSVVYATMKIKNTDINGNYISKLYCIPNGGVNDTDILVSESHLVLEEINESYIYVKDHPHSILLPNNLEEFFCLITHDHNINIGEYTFSDWEDNGIIPELNTYQFMDNSILS